MKQSLRFATIHKKIPFYLLGGFDLIKVNDARKVEALSDSDQEKLLKVSKEYSNSVNDRRRFIFFNTLLNTGMRYGEFIGLKWMDVNLDEKLLGHASVKTTMDRYAKV